VGTVVPKADRDISTRYCRSSSERVTEAFLISSFINKISFKLLFILTLVIFEKIATKAFLNYQRQYLSMMCAGCESMLESGIKSAI